MNTWLTGFCISNARLLNEKDLPESVKINKKYHPDTTINELLSLWLNNRVIPNSRIGLDDTLLSVYRLPSFKFGRMAQFQHTAAILSYFSSGFDHYYISPENTFMICYVYEDNRFQNMYFLKPAEWKNIKKFREQPNRDLESCFHERIEDVPFFKKGYLDSCSFTINSRFPSWWERDRNKRFFVQECDSLKKSESEFKTNSEMKYTQEFRDRKIYTDFSCLNEDIMWVSELRINMEQLKAEVGTECVKEMGKLNQFYPASGIGLLKDERIVVTII